MPDPFANTRASINDALQRVSDSAPLDWSIEAANAIIWCAKTYLEFTADDVWARLDELEVEHPHTKSALGPLFLSAKRDGTIENTGRLQPLSCRPCQHRTLIIWRSLIIDGKQDYGIFGILERRMIRRKGFRAGR